MSRARRTLDATTSAFFKFAELSNYDIAGLNRKNGNQPLLRLGRALLNIATSADLTPVL
jgi:hypothetical protein